MGSGGRAGRGGAVGVFSHFHGKFWNFGISYLP